MSHTQRSGETSPVKIRRMTFVSGVIILIIGICGCICSATNTSSQSADISTDPWEVLNQADTDAIAEPTGPTQSEKLESATLVLTHPPGSDRVPYTERDFSSPIQASIAWWKSPDFMDNTSEFRRYQRATDEERAQYTEDKQIFFNFIQESLDTAETQSSLTSDIILFRGISSSFADTILNNSVYREKSYASTSYDPVVSLDLFGLPDPQGYHPLLVMERTAGDQVLFINEDEREYLIPRGSEWQVVESVDIQNLTIEADFPLFNRTTMRDSFENVRLTYIIPMNDRTPMEGKVS